MLRIAARLAVIAIVAATAAPARAGLYADDLSRCLVNGATTKDKTELVRWVFANAALHPEIASMSTLSTKQRGALNRSVGQLFERLLTETCRPQFRDAMQKEGPQTIEMSFGVLGQVAMRELMTNPEVSKGFSELDAFISKDKITAAAAEEER